VCYRCYLQDCKTSVLYLMSAANNIDLKAVPDYLPELSQLKKMIIACSHVQIVVFWYRRHQYHYLGHCVSFMQNTVKTVNILPNFSAKLDIVLIRPLNIGGDIRFFSLFSTCNVSY
jgi:hypothetical protein